MNYSIDTQSGKTRLTLFSKVIIITLLLIVVNALIEGTSQVTTGALFIRVVGIVVLLAIGAFIYRMIEAEARKRRKSMHQIVTPYSLFHHFGSLIEQQG